MTGGVGLLAGKVLDGLHFSACSFKQKRGSRVAYVGRYLLFWILVFWVGDSIPEEFTSLRCRFSFLVFLSHLIKWCQMYFGLFLLVVVVVVCFFFLISLLPPVVCCLSPSVGAKSFPHLPNFVPPSFGRTLGGRILVCQK